MTGLFISFEGGEGCGKTTQCQLLAEKLIENNLSVLKTREPGGTYTAETLRSLLLDNNYDWEMNSEILLHIAARNEHVNKVINPALNENKIVICDRFLDSTVVYQGYAGGNDISVINQIHKLIIGNFYPDITFVLDLSLEESLKRLQSRNQQKDKYEMKDYDYHLKVQNGFREICKQDSAKNILIDASKSKEDIHNEIIQNLIKFKQVNDLM